MASIDTKTISNSKIKFRFSEPYASEGANIQQGVNLPGAYRGALVQESSPSTDRSFWINKETGDADSIILHRDATNGYCTVVRETSNIQMDCSSTLVWPIASETTLYVFMSVSYAIGTDTSGYFGVVSTPGEVPANAVMLAHIVLPVGATEILQEYVKTDGSKRDKVARKKGVIVLKKQIVDPTAAPRTGFEITDKVCWMGEYSKPSNRIRLGDDFLSDYLPMIGSDGGSVQPSTWYDVEGGTALSYSDMDEDGCYTNPWIQLSFNDTVDGSNITGFTAWYWGYVPFDEMDAEDRDAGFFYPHATYVYAKDQTGDPDSLNKGPLTGQLGDILDLINARIRTYNPEVAGTTWHLLWRSNNVVDDADVDNDTLSIYWSDNGLLAAAGGYIDGSDFKVDKAGATGQVNVVKWENRTIRFMTQNVTSIPFSADVGASAPWAQYKIADGMGAEFFNSDAFFDFYENARARIRVSPDDGTHDLWLELLSLCGNNLRVFWGGDNDTDNNDLYICWGCRWSESSGKWVKTSSSSFDARAIAIGRSGISLRQKKTTDGDYSTGWTNFSSSVSFDSIIKMAGSLEQKFIVPFKVMLTEDLVRGFRDPAYTGPTINEVVNAVFERPLSISGPFIWTQLGSVTLYNHQVSSTPRYLEVSADLAIADHLTPLTLMPVASGVDAFQYPDKIVLDASAGWPGILPGQAIGIKGAAINNMWVVTSIAYVSAPPASYVITVDDELGNNEVPNATDVGNDAYILKAEDAGRELVAFYEIKFSF